MENKKDNAVILFARDPILGQVKTRLSSSFDDETTLRLYTCFVEDSLEKIRQVDNADCFVGISPSNLSGFFNGIEDSDLILYNPLLNQETHKLVSSTLHLSQLNTH